MSRCRRPFILASFAPIAAFSLLAAGCGGGSPRGVASVASTTIATTTGATTTVATGSVAGALAFARCMRSHGIPNWPDPMSGGGFDKSKLQQLGVSVSKLRAIEESSCNYDFQNGRQGQQINPTDQADYLRAAACMRAHGYPTFPDPTFPNNTVRLDIPSSINQDSAAFTRAATTCTKLIPAGLPYTNPRGS